MTHLIRCKDKPDGATKYYQESIIKKSVNRLEKRLGDFAYIISKKPDLSYEAIVSFPLHALKCPLPEREEDLYVPHGGYQQSAPIGNKKRSWILGFHFGHPENDITATKISGHANNLIEQGDTYKTIKFAEAECRRVIDWLRSLKRDTCAQSPRRSAHRLVASQGHIPAATSYRTPRSGRRSRRSRNPR